MTDGLISGGKSRNSQTSETQTLPRLASYLRSGRDPSALLARRHQSDCALRFAPLSASFGRGLDRARNGSASHPRRGRLGGLLNATFGNAAELIIAGIALSKGLTNVVKASLRDRSSVTCCSCSDSPFYSAALNTKNSVSTAPQRALSSSHSRWPRSVSSSRLSFIWPPTPVLAAGTRWSSRSSH